MCSQDHEKDEVRLAGLDDPRRNEGLPRPWWPLDKRDVLRESGVEGLPGDDRSVKTKSLEAAKIMKIKWLVLGCIEAREYFCSDV